MGVMAVTNREQFDGLLNFRKPTGITSAKALYKVRAMTQVRKSGHAGTLDPAADGVLLLCMGKGTKRVERLMNLPKVYHAIGRLDVTSHSFDSDSPHEAVEVQRIPSRDEVLRAAAHLQAAREQVPPAVSAIKVRGVRSYKLARRGQAATLKPRAVRIDRLAVLRYECREVTYG